MAPQLPPGWGGPKSGYTKYATPDRTAPGWRAANCELQLVA